MAKQPVSCDQIIWLKNALDRYAERCRINNTQPRVADSYHHTDQVACMIEIMEVLHVECDDHRAVGNVLASVKAHIPQPKEDVHIGANHD